MKKVFLVIFSGVLLVALTASAFALTLIPNKYSDVSNEVVDGKYAGTKYFKAINFLSDEGVVNGYPDGTYKPNNSINRAEFLKIVVEAFYAAEFETYSDKTCFTDVKAKEWYTKYVCFAKEQGIVNGYEDGTFKPASTINLVEALKITLKTFGYEYAASDPWYKGLVEKAASKNFIPVDFTSFGQMMNRGQMADLITRIIKTEKGEIGAYLEMLGLSTNQVVTYDSLSKGTNVEGGGETPPVEDNLISKVCSAASLKPGMPVTCDDDKKKLFGCESAENVTYGDFDFVQCNKTGVSAHDVLVFGGGLLANGYNLIGTDENTGVGILADLDDLQDFWGTIKSGEDAREFVKAYMGYSEAFTLKEIKSKFGESIKLSVGEDTIKYSGVSSVDGAYEFSLYYKDIFGCSPFYVHEVTFTVKDKSVTEKDETLIADTGVEALCVD